jgi:hypothetical protein
VLRISEAGFGLETTQRVEQGESIRVRIRAHGAVSEVQVDAIVWYDHPAPNGYKKGALRLLGCVLPDRSPPFLELFAAVERRNTPRERPTAKRHTRPEPKPCSEDVDLPRSRDPLSPPKPEPEESLPCFRVQLRQVGGPRTRRVSVRACSMPQAAERALSQSSDPARRDSEVWEVLEVTPSPSRNGNDPDPRNS